MITLGVLSDTHIPDRVRSLKPGVLPIFRGARVNAILHAGDVCTPQVLSELGEIAPVYAVRGNRDWVRLKHLPLTQTLVFEGVSIGMVHGHGRWWEYFVDKFHFYFEGLQAERYVQRAMDTFPQVRVVVFGHTHLRINTWLDGRLCFSPGSACCPDERFACPSVGLLRIYSESHVDAEILDLE